MKEVQSLRERVKEIVEVSYNLLCNQIVGGNVFISNEASLQMQLGLILKQVGHLYEHSKGDRFFVDLEIWQEIEGSLKSKNGRARCDIKIRMENARDAQEAAIELKFFKHCANEAVTDNRFSILLDLQNLEKYKASNPELLCFEIVYTDNENYTKVDNRSKIKITPTISGNVESYGGRIITLDKTYSSIWDSYEGNHYFLKVDLND